MNTKHHSTRGGSWGGGGSMKRLVCRRDQNYDIHYTKIHEYDIICTQHRGFKFQNIWPRSQGFSKGKSVGTRLQNIVLGSKLPTSPCIMAELSKWFNCRVKFYLQANNVLIWKEKGIRLGKKLVIYQCYSFWKLCFGNKLCSVTVNKLLFSKIEF